MVQQIWKWTAVALTVCAACGAQAAPSVVGSFTDDTRHSVATFLPDGRYLLAADRPGDSVHTGVEWGTYSWDPITGLTPAVADGTTTGDWGLANDVDGIVKLTPSGNTLVWSQPLAADQADTTVTLTRVQNKPGSVLGTWVLQSTDLETLTFFADGTYIDAAGGRLDAVGGQPGIERGRYTFNSRTGRLVFTRIFTDTNGGWGASGAVGRTDQYRIVLHDGAFTLESAGDQDTLWVAAPQAAAVPEPSVASLLLAGLGVTGAGLRRRKTQLRAAGRAAAA